VLIFSVIIFILCIIAVYVAANKYLADQPYRTLIASISNVLQTVHLGNQINLRTINVVEQKNSVLDSYITRCNAVTSRIITDQSNVDSVQNTFNLYKSINETIKVANNTCNKNITDLTKTLNELINATTQNSTIVYSGLCKFDSVVVNNTILISYDYKLLNLNGIYFYYYKFYNSTGAVDASYGVKIQNCSPIIFVGAQSIKILNDFNSFVTSPLSMPNYFNYLNLGANLLEIVPKNLPSVNQTMQVVGSFNVWTNLF
jgi:hypothetical protein